MIQTIVAWTWIPGATEDSAFDEIPGGGSAPLTRGASGKVEAYVYVCATGELCLGVCLQRKGTPENTLNSPGSFSLKKNRRPLKWTFNLHFNKHEKGILRKGDLLSGKLLFSDLVFLFLHMFACQAEKNPGFLHGGSF